MSTYIIRIYRQEKDDPRSVVGIAEEVGKERQTVFRNFYDLWEILNASIRTAEAAREGQIKTGTESRI